MEQPLASSGGKGWQDALGCLEKDQSRGRLDHAGGGGEAQVTGRLRPPSSSLSCSPGLLGAGARASQEAQGSRLPKARMPQSPEISPRKPLDGGLHSSCCSLYGSLSAGQERRKRRRRVFAAGWFPLPGAGVARGTSQAAGGRGLLPCPEWWAAVWGFQEASVNLGRRTCDAPALCRGFG